jgi:hypothetical protein
VTEQASSKGILLSCIREVTGSNVCRKADWLTFFVVFFSLVRQIPGQYLKLDYDCFRPITGRPIIWVTDSIRLERCAPIQYTYFLNYVLYWFFTDVHLLQPQINSSKAHLLHRHDTTLRYLPFLLVRYILCIFHWNCFQIHFIKLSFV